MAKVNISDNVINRLPRYIRYLDSILSAGVERVSSAELSRRMGLTASQIRQDLNCFGAFGQPGYGYKVSELRQHIAEILGMNTTHTAILVGAGNLGQALLSNFRFGNSSFSLIAVFDVDPAIVGKTVSGIPVYHSDDIEKFIQGSKVDAAILTLPGYVANAMAERVTNAGVKGIWNFTNEELPSAAKGSIIENVHFSDSLQVLSYHLMESKN